MSEVITKCACGQLPALEPVQRGCEACNAVPGEECRPDCIGQAAHLDVTADESDGCTCCQVRTMRPGADDDECPKCGHLLGRHYRAAPR